MDTNEKIKMIGYTPSLEEQVKINYIAEVYHLTNTAVLKNLMYNKTTLNEFYERAKKYNSKSLSDEKDMNGRVDEGMVIM
jgi:hypothetical protein